MHHSEIARRRADLGQHGLRNAKQLAQPLVPLPRMYVEEHSATGIGGVGRVDLALSQIPDKPGIHRTEG